ncbi:hypothetical protein [Nocardia sp. NPDC005366]|uniref:hypothetical protein n=1 Tax=Nocardia sp. NPDC005366 TaxID=3156878 RepID=UPI0033B6B3B2
MAAATDAHNVALAAMRSEINTQFAAAVVGASVVIAAAVVMIKKPQTVGGVEAATLETAAVAIARTVGTFFTSLNGITFASAALATGGLATIAGLAILITSMDDHNDAAVPTLGGSDPITKEIARNIADHANGRAEQGDGTHYVPGVAAGDLAEYVRKVLDGEIETEQRHDLRGGRVAYWDPARGALVIENGNGGTVFTPPEGREKFEDLD